MKLSLLSALAACFVCGAQAQLNPFDSVFVQSISGQFTVVEPRSRRELPSPFLPTNKIDSVSVDPERLAVACERIKEALNAELEDKSPWQGKIHIFLHPVPAPEESITVVSERFPGGWNYRMDVPDQVERTALVRAIVSALLLELANRQADTHPAELPVWLTEGLTQQLMAAATVDLIPPAPRPGVNGVGTAPVSINERMKDPLDGALQELRAHPPLTIQGLSWPDEDSLDGDAGTVYRGNAQLFVHELLGLPDGRPNLRKMLMALPDYYNWQTAFFTAFGGDFPTQLDLEKWWALQVVHFTGPSQNELWTPEEGWRRLDEIVHTSVEIRQAKNDLPAEREADLRDVVRNLDYAHQKPLLSEKVQELDNARGYSVPELAGLVGDYREAISGYLKQRDQMRGSSSTTRGLASSTSALVNDLLRTLDELETKRAALRPKPAGTAEAGL